jgi:hypothetical protein
VTSFSQASPPTPCAHLYPPPYKIHALPISFVSILPPAQYWVRSNLKLFYLFLGQRELWAHCFETPTSSRWYLSPREAVSRTYTKLTILMLCITRSLAFYINRRRSAPRPSLLRRCHKKIRSELFGGGTATLFVSLTAAPFIVISPLRRIVVGPFVVTDLPPPPPNPFYLGTLINFGGVQYRQNKHNFFLFYAMGCWLSQLEFRDSYQL